MNSIDELRLVLPPPARPMNCTGDWAAVEHAIGLRLPSDYKTFISIYGSGMINGCLDVQSPFGIKTDAREWWLNWVDVYACDAKFRPISYPIFPEPGGLLPFGTLGDMDILNWRTVGESDQWPFVYYHRTEGFFEIGGLTAVDFVLEAVTRRSPLLARLRTDSVFGPPCDFEAYTPEPLRLQLVHAHAVSIDMVVDRLTHLWPGEQVRIRPRDTGVKLLVQSLGGSITIAREGDERTWCWIQYDRSCAGQTSEVVRQLQLIGFC